LFSELQRIDQLGLCSRLHAGRKLSGAVITNKILLVACIMLGFLTPYVAAASKQQGKSEAEKQKNFLFKMPVWVAGANVAWEQTLHAENFSLTDGKIPIDIDGVQGPSSPMLLFLAFDTVGEINNVDQARNGVKAELNTLDPQVWVGLISAQEQLGILQEPTSDRPLLKEKIDILTQIGRAGLLESILPLADLTSSILLKTQVRVASIVITDSDIGNYRADYLNPPVNTSDSRDLSRKFAGRALQDKISRMTLALARYQAPIFIVHIDPGTDALNRSYHNGLKQLAEAAGGQCFLSKTVGDIGPSIREAFYWAKSFYLVGFHLSEGKKGFKRIDMEIKNSPTPGPLRLIHPGRVFVP